MPALKPRTTSLVAVAAIVAALLAGCAAQTPAAPTPSGPGTASAAAVEWTIPRQMPEGKGSGADDGVFPRTVVHFSGETTLETAPEKVVVISTGQADAMLTLGIVPIGSTAGDGADMIPQYLYDAFADKKTELDAVTYVGNRFAPDIETIANLKADLIVMNTAGKDADALYASLSAIAPTVSMQGTGLYWKQDFLLLADSVGKTQEAQAWLDTYHADAAAFGAKVTGDPTVSFLRKNGDKVRVFGIASFSGSVAEDSGLARPESQSFKDKTSLDISAEQLELADADWVFYGVQGGDETELTSFALWPTLTAVANDRAVEVDDDVFYLNVGPVAARGILSDLSAKLG